jgi:hypothetical protein
MGSRLNLDAIIKTTNRLPFWGISSRGCSVGIATCYGIHDRGIGIQFPVRSITVSSPRRPHRLWIPPSLLCNGYWGLYPRGKSGRGVKLTAHLQIVSRSRERGFIHPLPPLGVASYAYLSNWFFLTPSIATKFQYLNSL